jgi:hypothetical protein
MRLAREQLEPGFALMLAGLGSGTEHQDVVARIRTELPPLFEMVAPMPFLALQTIIDEPNAWGSHVYEKGTYVEDLSDGVIEVIADHLGRKKSPMSLVSFIRLDGAYCEVADEDTAFGGDRSPRYEAFIVAMAPDPELLSADRAWVRDLWDALRPHAIGAGGGYVNGTVELGEDRLRGIYGPAKYDRLAQIKGVYDPANLFHLNGNIKPL